MEEAQNSNGGEISNEAEHEFDQLLPFGLEDIIVSPTTCGLLILILLGLNLLVASLSKWK